MRSVFIDEIFDGYKSETRARSHALLSSNISAIKALGQLPYEKDASTATRRKKSRERSVHDVRTETFGSLLYSNTAQWKCFIPHKRIRNPNSSSIHSPHFLSTNVLFVKRQIKCGRALQSTHRIKSASKMSQQSSIAVFYAMVVATTLPTSPSSSVIAIKPHKTCTK